MQLLFVDESGTPPPPGKADETPYFVLGSVAIPEDVWPKLSVEMARLKREYRVQGEIKWRYFHASKDSKHNSLSHMSVKSRDELRVRLLEALTSYRSVRVICVVAHAPSAYTLPYVDGPDALYALAYKALTERYQYYLQDLERTIGQRMNGIIVCDHRAPKDDQRLRDLHARLIQSDGPFTSRYNNIIEGLFIAPSHHSVGIQFADMVAGSIYRHVHAADSRYFNLIESIFRKSEQGRIEGYGLIYLPKRTAK